MGTSESARWFKNHPEVVALALFIVVIFAVFHFFGAALSGFLIGPTRTSPNFQNATPPSNPDIVVTNMSAPSTFRAGANNSINVTVNVTNGNGSAGLGNWSVNVTLFQTIPGGPNITGWGTVNSTAKAVYSIAIGDVDGDGDSDMLVGMAGPPTRISLYVNSGGNLNIASWTINNVSATDTVNSLAIGDLDSDGDNDVVAGIAIGGKTVNVYTNPGGGGVTISGWTLKQSSTASSVGSVAIGDIDNDGDADVVAGITGLGTQVSVYNNTGGNLNIGTWPVNNVTTDSTISSVAIGDLDNDGDDDIVAGQQGGTARFYVFNNTNKTEIGTWPSSSIFVSANVNSVAIGDINGDGLNDIVAAVGSKVSIYNNSGTTIDSSKWASLNVTTSDTAIAVAIGDIDGNGLNDVVAVLGSGSGVVSVYNNTGNINIAAWPVYNVSVSSIANAVAIGDLDADGDNDVVAGLRSTSDRVTVYNNSETSSLYTASLALNFTNISNFQQTYFFNWTPAITATGTFNLTAVADPVGNLTETTRSNNRIVTSSTFACVSPEAANELQVNNSTTLCTGTYLMNDTNGNGAIQIINSSLTLDCNGATIIGNNRAGNNIGLFVNNSSVTIKGCNFANYTYGALVNLTFDVNFTNNTFFNNTHGIFLNSTNQTTIWNQTLRFNDINGLWNLNSNNTTIINSSIYNNTARGIRMLTSINNTIQNNTIYNNTVNGLLIENTNTSTVFNNTVSYAIAQGSIYINFSSSNLSLKRNIVSDNGPGDGIVIYGYPTQCGWNLIENNTVFNSSTGAGIAVLFCPNTSVMNNTIYNNSHGITFSRNNYSMQIGYNYIYNNSLGINISNDWNVTIFNNTITGNNATTNPALNRTGIFLMQNAWINSSYINITTNNVSGQSVGINNSNAAPNYAHNVTIYNNYFNNSLMNAQDRSAGNTSWNVSNYTATNIVGKPNIAGNFWSDYNGTDVTGDYIGDNEIPWNVSGNISVGGDYAPYTLTVAVVPGGALGGASKSVAPPLEVKAPPKESEVIKEEARSVTVELTVGGKVEVRFGEAEKTYTYQKGIPFQFKVNAQTRRITAFINDNKLFEVDDFAYRNGKVGLRTYGTIAEFDNAKVTDIASTTGERPSALEDSFSDGSTANWKPYQGIWEVSSGAYVQRSRVPIEQVALAGKNNWADFTYEATVTLDPQTTDTIAGLVFRAQDENNMYGFFFDSNNRISLRKSVGGTWFAVGESEVHTIKVLSATSQRVRLLITSSPIIVDVIPGQKSFVDLNNDGENDLAILVSKVTGAATVEMTVEKLRLEKKPAAAVEIAKPEAAPEAQPAGEEPKVTAKVIEKPTEPQRMPPIYLIAVLSAAAVLLFSAYSYRTYKKRAEIQEIQKKLQFGETTFEEKPPEEKEKTAEEQQKQEETPESQKQEGDEENQ